MKLTYKEERFIFDILTGLCQNNFRIGKKHFRETLNYSEMVELTFKFNMVVD